MKKLILAALVALGAGALIACELGANVEGVAVATAAAQEPAGCSPIGSWYGYYAPPDNVIPRWMSTINGKSNDEGTVVLELIAFDNTLGGLYPSAAGGTLIRGVWKRTGGNTFAISALGFARDALGNAVYAARMHGTDTLIEGCSVVQVDVTLEILDPVTFEPLPPLNFPMPQAIHYGHRMTIDGPG